MKRARIASLWACTWLAACYHGTTSDIGPRLAPLPNGSSRAVVLDTQGRGVVGAEVHVLDTAIRLFTGRNGRGDFLANPAGRRRVRVDATNGAAVAGDRLGGYVVAQTFATDLPAVLHVPDLPDAASASVAAGTQASATTITTSGSSVLTIGVGTSVGVAGGGASTTLRCGELPAHQLPGDLPLPTTGAYLWSRGVLVAPADTTFTAGATLDVPDDLALGTGAPRLFRLDETTGEWAEVVATTSASGGRLLATQAVAIGGLYAFATPVVATSVSGRVVDRNQAAVPTVLVRVDSRTTTTDGSGNFQVDRVPLTDGAGTSRSARIELFAGATWLPERVDTTAVLQASTTALADLRLDTLPAANVRVQQVLRGAADPLQSARIGSQDGAVSLATVSDALGQAFFEDVPGNYVGYQTGRFRDQESVHYGQLVVPLPRDRRWFDTTQLLGRRSWFQGTRRVRATITDAVGGGSLRGGWLVSGTIAGQGLIGQANDGGSFFASRDLAGRVTAVQPSSFDVRSVLHAFTIVRPDADHLEFPMQRVQRVSIGAFDRHGLVRGTLLGADGTRQHELRVTRRLLLEEWWDAVVDGIAIPSSLPIDVDPAVTHGAFAAGVAVIGGNLAASELTTAGLRRTLHKIGVVQDLVPDEGREVARDIALANAANVDFALPGALTGVDPAIVASDLRLDLGLLRSDGLVVDVVRDLADNVTAVGDDLHLALPALTGDLQDGRWLALLRGTVTSGSDTLQHASLATFPGVAAGFRLPPFPTLLSPTAGASVASGGFSVQFTLPPGALYGQIELLSTVGNDTRRWTVVVPPDATEFTFLGLPATVTSPLVAGRTYTLTLSAFFATHGFGGSPTAYRDLTTFLQSVSTAERGVDRVARRTITITAN